MKENPCATKLGNAPFDVWLRDSNEYEHLRLSVTQTFENQIQILAFDKRECVIHLNCTKEEFEKFLALCKEKVLDKWEDF